MNWGIDVRFLSPSENLKGNRSHKQQTHTSSYKCNCDARVQRDPSYREQPLHVACVAETGGSWPQNLTLAALLRGNSNQQNKYWATTVRVHMGTEPKALVLRPLVSREAESQKDSGCWATEQEQGPAGGAVGYKRRVAVPPPQSGGQGRLAVGGTLSLRPEDWVSQVKVTGKSVPGNSKNADTKDRPPVGRKPEACALRKNGCWH